jgi:hypothetical protein
LIDRVERMCQMLEGSGEPAQQLLGGRLLGIAARMDAVLRHMEWGCPPDRHDSIEDRMEEMLLAEAAIAFVADLLTEQQRLPS